LVKPSRLITGEAKRKVKSKQRSREIRHCCTGTMYRQSWWSWSYWWRWRYGCNRSNWCDWHGTWGR